MKDIEKKLFYDFDDLKKEGDDAFIEGIIVSSIFWIIGLALAIGGAVYVFKV